MANIEFYKIHFDEFGQKEVLDFSIMKATTYTFYNPTGDDSVFVLLNTTFDPKGEGESSYVRSTVDEFFGCRRTDIRTVHDTLGFDRMYLKELEGQQTSLAIKFHESGHQVRSLLCRSTERMPLIHYAIMKTKRGSIRLHLVDLKEIDEPVKMPPRSKIGNEMSYETWCYLKKFEGGFGGF
jgi:hypothetical protein